MLPPSRKEGEFSFPLPPPFTTREQARGEALRLVESNSFQAEMLLSQLLKVPNAGQLSEDQGLNCADFTGAEDEIVGDMLGIVHDFMDSCREDPIELLVPFLDRLSTDEGILDYFDADPEVIRAAAYFAGFVYFRNRYQQEDGPDKSSLKLLMIYAATVHELLVGAQTGITLLLLQPQEERQELSERVLLALPIPRNEADEVSLRHLVDGEGSVTPPAQLKAGATYIILD